MESEVQTSPDLPKLESRHDVFKSDQINELAVALSKAQAVLGAVHKGEKGYGYNYASLASTIETAREPRSNHGLSVTQLLGEVRDNKVTITTMILHESGQHIGSTSEINIIDMKGCNEAQNFGASSSYLRRYALQAILNMASEDNDASSKGGGSPKAPKPKPETSSKPANKKPTTKRSGFGGMR